MAAAGVTKGAMQLIDEPRAEALFQAMGPATIVSGGSGANTAVGAALTDRSVIWVREDLNCEPAFWAQLPGNFAYIARKAVISSIRRSMPATGSLSYPLRQSGCSTDKSQW